MCFDWVFSERKAGYSMKGFWGQTKYFNKDGVQIGYSVKSFFGGGRKRYDMNGNLVSYTLRNFWGGYNTYDPQGNLIRRSRKSFWGGFNTYDKNGKKTHVSRKNFWEGMNHYEVDDTPKYESFYTVAKKSASASVSNNVSQPSRQEYVYNTTNKQSVSVEKVSSEAKNETISINKGTSNSAVNVATANKNIESKKVNYSLNDIPYTAPEIDKSTEYVTPEERSISVSKEEYVKLLVFSYKNTKEFPAVAYLSNGKVIVEPLILGVSAFEFSSSEIEKATLEKVDGLDMNVVDEEFASVCISKIGKEYEELLPEYSWEYDGTSRNQYVFECGMIVTEKSMGQLREKITNG